MARAERPRPLRAGLLGLAALLAGVPVAGCAGPGQLVAADGSHRLQATDRQSGITVILTTEAWDGGELGAGDDVTVVHMLVSNLGTEPVLLAPGDFDLRDARGFRYDLYDAGGSFRPAGVPDRGYDPGSSMNYQTIGSYDGELEAAALPWGELLPGTQMRGFVYFEEVEDSANHARLVWHAQTPDHRQLGDFAFDLHVARP